MPSGNRSTSTHGDDEHSENSAVDCEPMKYKVFGFGFLLSEGFILLLQEMLSSDDHHRL